MPPMAALLAALVGFRVVAANTGRDDSVFMLQSAISQTQEPNDRQGYREFAVGDHVLVSFDEMATPIKGSITGRNKSAGTYNVHLWDREPRRRDRFNVPEEVLSDARPQEKAEAEKESRALLEQNIIEHEKRAVAKMQRLDQELEREATVAAEQAAAEAERAAKRANAEKQMRKVELIAAEHNHEPMLAEQRLMAEAERKAELEAKKDRMEKARLLAKKKRQRQHEKEMLEAADELAKTHVQLTVIGRQKKKAYFTLNRKTFFGPMMNEVCDRFHIQLANTTFFYKQHPIKSNDFADKLKMGRAADIVLGIRRKKH